jgi:hypothetical protein
LAAALGNVIDLFPRFCILVHLQYNSRSELLVWLLLVNMDDDDAPPDLVDVSQLLEPEIQTSEVDLTPQQRVPITLVTGINSVWIVQNLP